MQTSLLHRSETIVQRSPAPDAEPATAAAGLPRFLREDTLDAGASGGGAALGEAGAPAGAAAVGAAVPGGPDACATIEEEERKARFRSRTFSALDFRPSAGYGKFDAYYWPASALMAAVVKMKFNYVQADNTPSPAALFQMWMSGQDISRFFWTSTEKRQFAEDYRRRVADRWSFAHTFRSTKACWPFLARPYVTPRVVGDAADAHFEVTVHKSAGPGIDYNSGFRAKNPGTAGWRGTGDLYSSDVQEEPNFNSVQVARSERQRLERAVAAAAVSPVLFDRDSAVIPAASLTALRALADVMKAKNSSDPAIPVVISGFASSEGERTRNERLAADRVTAVADVLRAAGVPQPLVASPRGPVGAPNDAANRKVEVAPSTAFESSYAGNRYSVAEHEFGHAIGLPDEYVNRSAGDLGAKQRAFVTLAQAAGVAPPDQWGDTTASQMSAGVDVLPRHYLTLWEALGRMTAPDILRSEWSID